MSSDKLAEVAAKPTRTAIPRRKASPASARPRPAYGKRRFGVDLDPDSEVIVTLGSKEGLANLAQAITAPGDVVADAQPSYPIHHFGFIIAGAAIRSIPAVPGPDFFDRLEKAMRYTVPRPKVLVIGYPSNPTAQTVDLAFYEKLVAFARRGPASPSFRDLGLCRNLLRRHADPLPDPPGRGAKEVAVEFTSMSKTYSMAGWRIGFAVEQCAADRRAGRVKSYQTMAPLRRSKPRATAALNRPRDIVDFNRALYKSAATSWSNVSARRPGHTRPQGQHVRLGSDPRALPYAEQHGVRQAASDRGPCRGRPRRRLRREGEGLFAWRWSRTSSGSARRAPRDKEDAGRRLIRSARLSAT